MGTLDTLVATGEIGGRTVQIIETGDVVCARYEPAPLPDGWVRIRTIRSAISPGTEMTFYGRDATNVRLSKSWNPELRLFESGAPSLDYPVTFGYRAAGVVEESRSASVAVGERIYGSWRHTEFTSMSAERAGLQLLPIDLSWDDSVDIGHMGPICVNAAAFGEGAERGLPAVVFGAGPVGLITAQVVRANGAGPVYIVDRLASRLSIAETLGFTAVGAAAEDIARQLKEIHGSEAIPVAWECTGSTAALNEAIRIVKRQGTVVAVGFYQGEAQGLHLGDEFHHNGVRIVSGQIGNIHSSLDMARLRARTLELLQTGDVVLGRLPRLTLPVEDVARGFRALADHSSTLQVGLTYDG